MTAFDLIVSLLVIVAFMGALFWYVSKALAAMQTRQNAQPEQKRQHRLTDVGRYRVSIYRHGLVFRTTEACEILRDVSGAVFVKAAGDAEFTAIIGPYVIEKIWETPPRIDVKAREWHYRVYLGQKSWDIVKAYPLTGAHGFPAYHLVLTNGRSVIVCGDLRFVPVESAQSN